MDFDVVVKLYHNHLQSDDVLFIPFQLWIYSGTCTAKKASQKKRVFIWILWESFCNRYIYLNHEETGFRKADFLKSECLHRKFDFFVLHHYTAVPSLADVHEDLTQWFCLYLCQPQQEGSRTCGSVTSWLTGYSDHQPSHQERLTELGAASGKPYWTVLLLSLSQLALFLFSWNNQPLWYAWHTLELLARVRVQQLVWLVCERIEIEERWTKEKGCCSSRCNAGIKLLQWTRGVCVCVIGPMFIWMHTTIKHAYFFPCSQVLKQESELREGLKKVESLPSSDHSQQLQQQLTNILIRKEDLIKQSILLDDEITHKEKSLKAKRKRGGGQFCATMMTTSTVTETFNRCG